MWVTPFTLEGKFLRLEPLSYDYIAAFQAHYSPELYQYVGSHPQSASDEDIRDYFQKLIEDPTRCSCVIVMPDGKIAGRTGYMDIREKDKALESFTARKSILKANTFFSNTLLKRLVLYGYRLRQTRETYKANVRLKNLEQ
jgi:RimJ/RimL family protein N-acetyltransferase